MAGRYLWLVVIAGLGCFGCGSSSPTPKPKPARHARTHPRKEVELGTTPIKARPRPRHHRQTAKPRPVGVSRPPIKAWFIPYQAKRRQEMRAYSERHYGRPTFRLIDPKVIVEHYTETPTAQATYNLFARDTPDPELHELPNVCSHFLVDKDGTIYQLVPLAFMCRHTVGLNYTAIGVENVGSSDAEILHNRRQLRASLRLTRWLRCGLHIRLSNVIGHNESLSSPYHHELVPALRTQTHQDWTKPDMDVYRARLRARRC